jgi:hypothetical protein
MWPQGPIDTDMIHDLGTNAVSTMIADSPMKRLGTASEVAQLVVWLRTEARRFNRGAVFDPPVRIRNRFAWNCGSPDAVAEFYAQDGRIVIDHGEPWVGRAGVAEMAAGFFADVPDLSLVCDEVRCAGDHVVYLRTFTGTHSGTRTLRVVGWEEWDLDAELRVKASRGWFDTDDYGRQTAGE